jgi:hypothetical protein
MRMDEARDEQPLGASRTGRAWRVARPGKFDGGAQPKPIPMGQASPQKVRDT